MANVKPVTKKVLVLSIAILLSYFLFFYRYLFFSKLDLLPGDTGDSRLILFILEHWFKTFQGKAEFLSPPMFYPIKHTLGYTDALFLYALPYSLFRVSGCEMFTAYQFTLLLIHLLGLLGLFYFLYKIFEFHPFAATVGCIIAMLPNSLYLAIIHTQLLAVGFIPILMVLGAKFVKYANDNFKKRIFYAIGFILLLSALFITGYYTAWFFCFFMIIFGSVYFVIHYDKLKGFLSWLNGHLKECLFYFIVFIFSMIPFLVIYLPIAISFGPRPYWEVKYMLPSIIDLVNVGSDNLIWGQLFKTCFSYLTSRPYAWELSFGLPFLTLLTFFMCGIISFKAYRHKKSLQKGKTLIYFSLFIAVVITWGLILKIKDEYSLWWFIYKFIPGASAIRAVFRIQNILSIPVGIVIGAELSHFIGKVKNKKEFEFLFPIIIISLFFIIEQMNLGNMFGYTKSSQLNFLKHVPPPPTGCKVFYIKPNINKPFYELSTDAMLIAQIKNIFTINGYSGQSPKDYRLVNINDPNFNFFLKIWLGKHKLFGKIAVYDLEHNRWFTESISPFKVPKPILSPLPEAEFKANIKIIDSPKSFLVNETKLVKVQVYNKSGVVFTSLGRKDGWYGVKLAYEWINEKGKHLGFNNRILIFKIAPGAHNTFLVQVKAPSKPGRYTLVFDLVQEMVAWFHDKGNKLAKVKIKILPPCTNECLKYLPLITKD